MRGSKWEPMYRVAEIQGNVEDREDIRIPLLDRTMEEMSPLVMRSEMGWVYLRKVREDFRFISISNSSMLIK